MSTTLPDQAARDRFIREIDQGFSVIAPAGVGKTRAIVDRVVSMIADTSRRDRIASLAVVTYTNKAANEMRQRVCNALLARDGGAALMSDFNRAFFGTIHSFCLRLLRTYGHFLGLPTELEMVNEAGQAAQWAEFYRQFAISGLSRRLPPDCVTACFRHLEAQAVLGLAGAMPIDRSERSGADCNRVALPGPCPAPDFSAILEFVPTKRNISSVADGQALLRSWQAAFEAGAEFLPLPTFEKGGKEFKEVWKTAFAPLRDWLAQAAHAIAATAAEDYRDYRIAKGQLTYADQIGFVSQLLDHPEAGALLRAEGFRIILDEAQDTDPAQFRVLLQLASPAGNGPPVPGKGRFCMVGDPQQSIYGSRADLSFYQSVSERLVADGGVEELEFHVTFRCDEAITRIANELCPPMLNGAGGQVPYVTLAPRPGATPGQVVRLPITRPATGDAQPPDGPAAPQRARRVPIALQEREEARQLADWLRAAGPAALGASSWSDVAILCARKRWLPPLEQALLAAGLPVQNQSRREIQGDDPGFAWFAALIICMSEPRNPFELVGVLREVFGLPDATLHEFAATSGGERTGSHRLADGTRFQLETETPGDGPVCEILNRLHALRRDVVRLPLFEAARRVVEVTRLRERITAIGSNPRPIDVLLSQAAAAEAEGASLSGWAQRLREEYNETLYAPPAAVDAIHLITCHAAKGLEWDAVLVPFLHRPIANRGNEYPYLHHDRQSGRATVVFDKESLAEEQQERIKAGIVQENQRLLYVAITRARRTLVLADDAELLGQPGHSFAACLGLLESRPAAWVGLPAAATTPALPDIFPPIPSAATPEAAPAGLSAKDRADARATAESFPRRILPHTLAEHGGEAEPEAERDRDPEWETPAGETARRYGLWWHALVEALEWTQPETWNAAFAAALPQAPAPERAQREWTLFRASEAAAYLSRPDVSVRVELPFLRAISPTQCVEGYIDLVAHDPDSNDWLVLDWKTNRIAPDGMAGLAALYAPQLEPYAIAVKRHAGPLAQVRAMVYSTACGRWMECGGG